MEYGICGYISRGSQRGEVRPARLVEPRGAREVLPINEVQSLAGTGNQFQFA